MHPFLVLFKIYVSEHKAGDRRSEVMLGAGTHRNSGLWRKEQRLLVPQWGRRRRGQWALLMVPGLHVGGGRVLRQWSTQHLASGRYTEICAVIGVLTVGFWGWILFYGPLDERIVCFDEPEERGERRRTYITCFSLRSTCSTLPPHFLYVFLDVL